jgi:predicted DsbA family dithiol-disulfide isomerase
VHYDFASSLCYVAHRVIQRLTTDLDALGIELVWSPVDLAHLIGRIRGAETPPAVRENVARVATELRVPLRVPRSWMDSRPALGAALVSERAGRGAAFREAVWSSVYDDGREIASTDASQRLAADLGLALDAAAQQAAQRELEARTEAARSALVTGVPTFVFGAWPCGGIQTEDTMRRLFQRFAEKARRRLAS